ncbi:cytochrome b/b6 domain-containing protein [Aliiroseovarius subalbicans]|uniref:cytochrome b n=1 Tax=Aliiroseovarius subalbicans TaxID=2925840 RepID=UPI001F5A9DBA|nr:cytochrome b/b6 domain-containing protein [Aliiroseovarius subalbicans]MCI2398460.1 cytochrome b/b6 domain-containing protein [Aliiroseovarius subalbicans]
MTRYHPLLVALHWIVAALIIGALIMGGTQLAEMPNSDPGKIAGLRAHMTVGMVIGGLLILRLITRFSTAKPPHADAGNAVLNLGGRVAHWALYGLALLMVASGMGISLSAGLPDIVFGGADTPLPADFSAYPPRAAHGIVSKLLALTILAHVAGWAYHQFIRRDGLIRRMWFGKREG